MVAIRNGARRRHARADPSTPGSRTQGALRCPFDLHVGSVPRFLNAELVDHDVYDGVELQWFDDPSRGTGMLAFLQRRADRRVDYYVEPGLALDRVSYELGGGTGRWVETTFEANRLEVDGDGVVADVRFHDVDGRTVEIRLDDRDVGPRNAGELLAPVGADIDTPRSLLLVYVHGFDLVRRGRIEPVIRIDAQPVSTGRLPGARWHGRHLIKAGAPLSVATLCRSGTRELEVIDPQQPGEVLLDRQRRGIRGLSVAGEGAEARIMLRPAMPSIDGLADGQVVTGAWEVSVDGARLTGGRWGLRRVGHRVEVRLDVSQRWRPPPGQPLLMRVVTRVVPTFRRWPTTYRWRAEVHLDDPPRITSRWERTTTERGERYRAATSPGSSRG